MGKGVALHLIAKVVVIFSGFCLQFLLARVMSVAEYGVVGLIIMLTNFYYMFLTDGAKQSISNSISSHAYDAQDAVKKAVVVQIALGIGIGALNFFLAPLIADLYHDASLVIYFQAISVMIPLTAVFFVYTGVLNGIKFFLGETVLLMLYPLLRLSAIPFAYSIPQYKPLGVIVGFTIASFVALIVALVIVKRKGKVTEEYKGISEKITYRATLKGMAGFVLFFAGIIVMLNMGVFILRAIVQSNEVAGYYTAVYNFALIPYYIISAFFLVLLPYVSECHQRGETEQIKEMVRKDIHVVILFVLPIAILLCCSAGQLLASFYGKDYLPATLPMQIQVFGVFFLAIAVIFNIVLAGMKKQRKIVGLTIGIVAVDVCLHIVLIRWIGITGASVATLISALLMLVLSYGMAKRQTGAFLDLRPYKKALVIIAAFTVLCILIFRFFDIGNLVVLILVYLGLAGGYLLLCAKCNIFKLSELRKMMN